MAAADLKAGRRDGSDAMLAHIGERHGRDLAAIGIIGAARVAGTEGHSVRGPDRAKPRSKQRGGQMTRGLMLLAGATVVAGVALPCAILAEEKPERKPWNRWAIAPGVTSANLAHTPWVLVQSTGLSWPDGHQAVV